MFLRYGGLSVAGKGALSSISTLKKTVRRVRHQNGPQIPVAPLTLFDLEIPESFKDSYRNNADFNLYARMITALAFVPPENVVESFEMLSEELEQVEPTLQPILDWLEMYYIGILRIEGVRRVPTFPIETWNLYNRVLTEQMVRIEKEISETLK
ncbi:hypothetical protein ACI65C_013485 [Semiaphis heraclei]